MRARTQNERRARGGPNGPTVRVVWRAASIIIANAMMRSLASLLLLVASSHRAACMMLDSTEEDAPPSWRASLEGSWTDRLGLRFKDDCQEDTGVQGLIVWLWSWVARRGQQRSGHCESREMRCPAGQKLTGLHVRYGRLEHSDRDLYDFRPRCGATWESWLGMKFPSQSEADHFEQEGAVCPIGQSVTGIQVMRGRNDRRDWDYYNFKLRCNKQWADVPLGLAFDGLRETRSATCPSGAAIAGLRVHRGFQDWGDVRARHLGTVPTSPCVVNPIDGMKDSLV